jgi:hypothetical protein
MWRHRQSRWVEESVARTQLDLVKTELKHTRSRPNEKINTRGNLSFIDMCTFQIIGMMTQRMAVSEERLKTACTTRYLKYVAHSSCGGGSVQ